MRELQRAQSGLEVLCAMATMPTLVGTVSQHGGTGNVLLLAKKVPTM